MAKTYRYLATARINAGALKQGMSVIIVRKAFMEQKGERVGYCIQGGNEYTITEITT